MTAWTAHVTVATVVEKDGKFLFVEEHTAGVRRDNHANKHKEPHHSPHEQGGFEAVVVFVHFSFPVSTSHAGVCSGVLG